MLQLDESRSEAAEAGENYRIGAAIAGRVPFRKQLPQVGPRDPALSLALLPEISMPELKLLRILTIAPKIAFMGDMPLGNQLCRSTRHASYGINVEEIRMLLFDDTSPKNAFLGGRKQGGTIGRVVAQFVPTSRKPCVDAMNSRAFPRIDSLIELICGELL